MDKKETKMFIKKLDPKNPSRILLDPENRKRICNEFPILYHAVPEAYASIFENGIIVIDKVSNIREIEEKTLRENRKIREGTSLSVHKTPFYIGGDNIVLEEEYIYDFFFLCFSTLEKIKLIREKYDGGKRRALYEINMVKIIPAIINALQKKGGIQVEDGGNLCYFIGKQKYEKGRVGIEVTGDTVKYIDCLSDKGNQDPVFEKDIYFENECEFRLAFTLFEDGADEEIVRRVLTTTGNNKIKIKINPSGCFKRIK